MGAQEKQPKAAIAAAIRAEQWSEALPLLEVWCAEHPQEVRGWYNRGYCLFRLSRAEEAAACLHRCVELEPGYENAHKLLAHLGRSRPAATAGAEGADAGPSAQPLKQPAHVEVGGDSVDTEVSAGAARLDNERVWKKGALVGGRYEVREVARGGMGVVYLAHDRELERMVAVKTPLPSALATDDGRARFFREAEAWVALGVHPNICTAYYVQEVGGVPRLFIEYVDGGDLDGWLSSESEIAVEQRLDITIQVARGMHHTHCLRWTDDAGAEHVGLVHRDLKPGNVLMSTEGVARVTDFGLVRAESGAGALTPNHLRRQGDSVAAMVEALKDVTLDAELSSSWQTVTMAGGVLGTPPYVAPEIWRGTGRAGAASDIYAFGCILYEIFCARRPFVLDEEVRSGKREAQLVAWLKAHVREQAPDPADLAEGIDPGLRRLMRECLTKDPEQRPQSFAVIRDRLTEIYHNVAGEEYPRPEPHPSQLLADSLNNRAVSFVALGHPGRAEVAWREALAADPRHREATFNLAIHEWHSSGLTDAEVLRRMDEVAGGDSSTWRDHHLRGRALFFLDQLEAATRAFEMACADPGASLDVYRDLGLALVGRVQRGHDCVEQARAAFETVLERAGADLVATVGLTALLWTQGRRAEAEKAWTAATGEVDSLPISCEKAFDDHLPGFDLRHRIRLPGLAEAVTPAGDQRMLCRSAGGRITLWSVVDGGALGNFEINPAAKRARAVAVRGERLVAGGEGISLAQWDLASGRRVARCTTQPGRVTAVAVNSDGSLALTGGSDRVMRLWDLAAGTCLSTFAGHDAFVSAVAFSSSGEWVASASGDGKVRIFDLGSGEAIQVLEGHGAEISVLLLSGDGLTAVTAGESGAIRSWEVITGAPRHTFTGHHGRVVAMDLSADGRYLVSGGDDNTVRCWRLEEGVAVSLKRCDHRISDLAVDHENAALIITHGDVAEVVDLPWRRPPQRSLALTQPITSGETEARQKRFHHLLQEARSSFAAGALGRAMTCLGEARALPGHQHHSAAIELVDEILAQRPRIGLGSMDELRSIDAGEATTTIALFTNDEAAAVVANGSAALRVVDLHSGTVERSLVGPSAAVAALAVSASGEVLAAASRDGAVLSWRLSDGARLGGAVVHRDGASAVVFDARDELWLSAGGDGVVIACGLATENSPQAIGRLPEAVASLAASADGRFVVAGGWDQTVVVWEVQRSRQLHVLDGHGSVVSAVAVSPDCRRIASGGSDRSIRIWALNSGRCLRTLTEGIGEITCVAYSPDARYLLAGARDGRLQVWDTLAGTCVRTIEAHVAAVNSAVFSADGIRALSAGADGKVRLWHLDWEPEVEESGAWDDRARPLLEVFLHLRTAPAQEISTPEWQESDLDHLMADLARRGFGRLGRAEVEEQLHRLAGAWIERRQAAEQALARRHEEQARRQRRAPIRGLAHRLGSNLGWLLAGLAAVIVVTILAAVSLRTPGATEAELNNNLYPLLKATHDNEARSRKTSGLVFAFHAEPTLVEAGGDFGCSRADRHRYLDVVSNPQRHANQPLDPAAASADESFALRYQQAVICLPSVVDPGVINSLVQLLARNPSEQQVQDLITIFVQCGDLAVARLAGELVHPDPALRRRAAWALAVMREPQSMTPLVEALVSGRPAAVDAASTVIQELITAEVLPPQEGFELIRGLSANIDSEVRRNAIYGLAAFADLGPVKELLDEAADDPHQEVRTAAELIRGQLREARRKEILGR